MKNFILTCSIVLTCGAFAQNESDKELSLELLDESDAELLLKYDRESDVVEGKSEKLTVSEAEEIDDLESLREDVGDLLFDEDIDKQKRILKGEKIDKEKEKKEEGEEKSQVATDDKEGADKKEEGSKKEEVKEKKVEVFDVGQEEKNLLALSKFLDGKIPADEWNEIAVRATQGKYVVQKGEWLWKISKELFGSGFYYAKIWSLNPHITNPHQIEPGTVLVFDTGNFDSMPTVTLGSFEAGGVKGEGNIKDMPNFAEFGDESEPSWISERKKLVDQGVFFQYASDETYDDLAKIGKTFLNTEYKKYEPPVTSITIEEPTQAYDDAGFDKSSKIVFQYSEGFYLNTFVTTNVVQDLGYIAHGEKNGIALLKMDTLYVSFDKSVVVRPGDKFSVYAAEGKVSHEVSDREGFRYTVTAEITAREKKNDMWKCVVSESSAIALRKDRVTVHTPKITQITKTFNKRNIETAVIGSYKGMIVGASIGDVVYLDRGRADGVEMGNVFTMYSFHDRGTGERITPDPTYEVGEITVISLTDNFATGLVTSSKYDFGLGTIGITKSSEEALMSERLRSEESSKAVQALENSALENLDVELNLDGHTEDLLNKVDQARLTDDELEELERRERTNSVIKDHERDIKELDRLEREIEEEEKRRINEKGDEDKLLEGESLEKVEGDIKAPGSDAFESLDEVEHGVGKKFMDEDLNAKENPYGLTEFDLEEIDELLNTDQ